MPMRDLGAQIAEAAAAEAEASRRDARPRVLSRGGLRRPRKLRARSPASTPPADEASEAEPPRPAAEASRGRC